MRIHPCICRNIATPPFQNSATSTTFSLAWRICRLCHEGLILNHPADYSSFHRRFERCRWRPGAGSNFDRRVLTTFAFFRATAPSLRRPAQIGSRPPTSTSDAPLGQQHGQTVWHHSLVPFADWSLDFYSGSECRHFIGASGPTRAFFAPRFYQGVRVSLVPFFFAFRNFYIQS